MIGMNQKQNWDHLHKDHSKSVKCMIMVQLKFRETDMKKLLIFVGSNPTEVMKKSKKSLE